jgi:hypothetical protein
MGCRTANILLKLLFADIEGLLSSLTLGERVTVVQPVSVIDDVIRQAKADTQMHSRYSWLEGTGTADRSMVEVAGEGGEGDYEPSSSASSARRASVTFAQSGRSNREGPGQQSPVGCDSRSDDGLAEHCV